LIARRGWYPSWASSCKAKSVEKGMRIPWGRGLWQTVILSLQTAAKCLMKSTTAGSSWCSLSPRGIEMRLINSEVGAMINESKQTHSVHMEAGVAHRGRRSVKWEGWQTTTTTARSNAQAHTEKQITMPAQTAWQRDKMFAFAHSFAHFHKQSLSLIFAVSQQAYLGHTPLALGSQTCCL